MINLGGAIKRVRTELGVKQVRLAAKTKVTASYLSLVENGRVTPSLSFIAQVSKGLGVPEELILWEAIELPEHLKPEQKQAFYLAKLITQDYLRALKQKSVKHAQHSVGRSYA